MKYMTASIIAMILFFGAGYLPARVICKKTYSKHRGVKVAVLTAVIGTALLAAAALVYFADCYHADEKAKEALRGSDSVAVIETDGGYFFDGPDDSKAIVFYPGAKVECEAYAPLMLRLADEGFDCFLADMPLNFALLGGNSADKFKNRYSYDTWIMAGHSMGGIMAASYAEKNPDETDGIILLAAYTTTKLDDGFKLCSIYGSEDGCLERDVYADNKDNWPEKSAELVIEGGNHAQFGDYGVQKGDGTAGISAEEQQRITAETVSEVFGNSRTET